MVSCSGPIAIVVGDQPPALSISWAKSEAPERWSGYVVFMSECRLDVPEEDWPEDGAVCLRCLIRDGDEQLGRGLDLARLNGQVDYDLDTGEWFLPLYEGAVTTTTELKKEPAS